MAWRIPPRGSIGRFYAPVPTLRGRLARVVFVGAFVAVALFAKGRRHRGGVGARGGNRDDPWPPAMGEPATEDSDESPRKT